MLEFNDNRDTVAPPFNTSLFNPRPSSSNIATPKTSAAVQLDPRTYQDGLLGPIIPTIHPIQSLLKRFWGIIARPGT